jgi:photosystem II stability/assembly factor-like uncharacterized protein
MNRLIRMRNREAQALRIFAGASAAALCLTCGATGGAHADAAIAAQVHGPAKPSPALAAISFATVKTGWAAGQDVILGTADGGRIWRRLAAGSDGAALARFLGKGAVSAQGQLSSVTMQYAGLLGESGQLLWYPVANTKEWQYAFYRLSTDGGRRFTLFRLPAAISGQVADLRYVSRQDGWILTTGGQLFATTDGGRNWYARG